MRIRLIILAVLASVFAVGYTTGLYQYLAPEKLREFADAAGAFGPLVIVVLFGALQPFGVPGAVFMLATIAMWPLGLAFLVNWIGATCAGMFGFAFARYFGRDWVSGRLPPRLKKWDDRLSSQGLPIVIGFRAIFFLNPVSHWALGLSRVPATTATLGTAIAYLPWTAAWTYFGAQIIARFQTHTTEVLIGIAAILLAVYLVRRLRGGVADSDPKDTF
ncbi:MAG TPA: TVP38/TMEM64 family protein [Gemmatimonadetes bacterium]|nr:TVP38/TMEM64 family protein [Gemmatimonadota bacterium]